MLTVTLRNTFTKFDETRIVASLDDAREFVSDRLREMFKATTDEQQREYCQDVIERLHKGVPSYGRGVEDSIAYDIVDYMDWKRHQDEQVNGLIETIQELTHEIEEKRAELATMKGT